MITLSLKNDSTVGNKLKDILQKLRFGQIWRGYGKDQNEYFFLVIHGFNLSPDLTIVDELGNRFSMINIGNGESDQSVSGAVKFDLDSVIHKYYFEYVGMMELTK